MKVTIGNLKFADFGQAVAYAMRRYNMTRKKAEVYVRQLEIRQRDSDTEAKKKKSRYETSEMRKSFDKLNQEVLASQRSMEKMKSKVIPRYGKPGAGTARGWWLRGDVPFANCILAYRAKGATSLANSYINLANPGVYNLDVGVAPTFDSATGWTFDGSTQWLSIAGGVGPNCTKPMSVLVRLTVTNNAAIKTILSSTTNSIIRFSSGENFNVYIAGNLVGSPTGDHGGLNDVVGFTYDAVGNYVYYSNGISTHSGTENLTPSEDYETIGVQGASNFYIGVITAISLYNICLTPTQVKLITNEMLAF